MNGSKIRSFWMLSVLMALGSVANGQWSNDPMQNLVIADRPSEQATPKVAGTSDGGCYVAWFDLASGNYDVYLQRLDRDGAEQWPHNGILVSLHPQNSSLVDWDLIADTGDNAVIVFGDARAGSDLDIYAYKISPDAEFLWGPDGVTISDNADFEPAPRVTETDDGQFVVVWARFPDVGDGKIMMQRLTSAGVPVFPAGGIPIAGEAGEDPANPAVVPSLDGGVIVSWVRDTRTLYGSPRHLRAERFSAAGTSLWGGPLAVFDAGNLPIAYAPPLQADGEGGALFVWHYSPAMLFDSLVQHLDAAGNERFPHNGVLVSTTPNRNHLDPTLAHRRANGDHLIFWRELNSGQSAWGMYGQRISADGSRLWGNGGVELMPIDGFFKFALRSAPVADGAMLFWIVEPTATYGQNHIVGMRVDADGNEVWSPSPILVSSYLSGKSRLPITIDAWDAVKLIWEDTRNGTPDIYGQSVNPDGSLGSPITRVGDAGITVPSRVVACRPNPFARSTEILVFVDPAIPDARLAIYDTAGRLVRQLPVRGDDTGKRSLTWDGRDAHGAVLPAGVYFCRLADRRGAGGGTKMTLLR